MISPTLLIESNAHFKALTGNPVVSNYFTESAWFEWFNALPEDAFTLGDLAMVVAYVRRNFAPRGSYNLGTLRFQNLIADCQKFGELRQMARAEKRQRDPQPARTEVLRATGRTQPTKEPETAGAALERTKLAGMLGEWRKANNL